MLRVSARGERRPGLLAAASSSAPCSQRQGPAAHSTSGRLGERSPQNPGELRGGEGNQGGHSPSSERRTSCSVTLSSSRGINLVVLWGRNTTSCPGSGISPSWISPGWEFTLTLLNLFFALFFVPCSPSPTQGCLQGCSFAALLPADFSWQNLFPFHTRLVQEARPRLQWSGFVWAGKVLITRCCHALHLRELWLRTRLRFQPPVLGN